MDCFNKTDYYLSLYQEASALKSETVLNSNLAQLAQRLGAREPRGSKQKILISLTETARREYLYYWSLELNSESTTEDELSSLAESLKVEDVQGTPDETIIFLRNKAIQLANKTHFEQLPPEVLFLIESELDFVSQYFLSQVSHYYREHYQKVVCPQLQIQPPNFPERIIDAARNGHKDVILWMTSIRSR